MPTNYIRFHMSKRYTYLPYSTPLWIDLGLSLALFAGSGGKYLFHRIGWKGRIWQLRYIRFHVIAGGATAWFSHGGGHIVYYSIVSPRVVSLCVVSSRVASPRAVFYSVLSYRIVHYPIVSYRGLNAALLGVPNLATQNTTTTCSKLFLFRARGKTISRSCCPYGLRVICSIKTARNLTTTPQGKKLWKKLRMFFCSKD